MLYLHRAERADRLADVLAEILAAPLDDPFAAEVVSVPTRGIERWLVQRLSARLGAGESDDGVCANIDFPFPRTLVGSALALASGIEPAQDPWLPERMVWPLIEVVEASLEEPWLELLATHLKDGNERRFARVRHLAYLFREYSVRRPELLLEWTRGENLDPDGSGGWQARLWLALRERIGVPSGAERLGPASERLRAQPDMVDLPARFSLFGLTRLAAGHLQVLHALAADRDVHLMLLHPSPVLWQEVSKLSPSSLPLRADDPTAQLGANRLLASWGRDSRELQLVLTAGSSEVADEHHAAGESEPATLLGRLQADIRGDRRAPGEPRRGEQDGRLQLAATDDSVRIHSCHGRGRQVEVLREAILHRLAADPTLEPRDIIVMCPDIETFAPLIQAAFGTGGDAEEIDLRVRLADRSLRQVNSLLGVVARLLELAHARLTASEVLDFADTAPVRRRFGLRDDDLTQMQTWVADAGIHWGLDAKHRADFKMDRLDDGTWRPGLRRLLLGVALSEADRRLFGDTLPLDVDDSGDIDLAGRFTELVERLGTALDALTVPHTVEVWARELATAVDALTSTDDRDAWQRRELDRVLGDIIAEATGSTALTLPEIRALLADRLAGRATRANFRSGHLTVCTLMPMRSVPHRVVCLLGLDDGVFPRKTARDGDNLLLHEPVVGDRDPRSEDRQLLLDALLAAREALIITYSGSDVRTNQPLTPAVPIGELFDAIRATARPEDGEDAVEQVLTQHPLQPFDALNFTPGGLGGTGPWSYDEVSLKGAQALRLPRSEAPPFLPAALPAPAPARTLALADLIAFARNPVKAFLSQRLGLWIGSESDDVADGLPIELGGLEDWRVGHNLLEGLLAGIDSRSVSMAELRRGSLPPGKLGEPAFHAAWPQAKAIADTAREHDRAQEPETLECNVTLPTGIRLTGTVSGVRGSKLLGVGYSRLRAEARMTAWVQLLALTAARPDVPYEAITIGRPAEKPRNDERVRVAVARIAPLADTPADRAAVALAELSKLVALRDEGLREPLPLPSRAGAAYAQATRQGGDGRAAADAVWTSGWAGNFYFSREDEHPESQIVFGGELPPDELLDRYAAALWEPLLSRETVTEFVWEP